MSTPIDIQTLLSEGTCYTCFAPTPVPEIAILSLWGRIAGGGSAPCVPLAAPVATDSTDYLGTEFIANWNAVVGAVTYYIDVSTDPLFGSFFSIYQNASVGAPSVEALILGTDPATTYYYRVRASALEPGDLSCLSAYSNVITVLGGIVANSLTTFSSISAAANSFTTSAYTPTANALVLAFINSTNVPSSVTGNGLTWVLVKTLTGSPTLKGHVYRAMGAAPTNTGLTVAVTPQNCGIIIHVQEYTNVNTSGTNGSGAINQFMATQINNSGLQPLNANSLNAAVGFSLRESTTTGATLEGSWTQDVNTGQNSTLTSAMFVAHRLATTDNTFTTLMSGSVLSIMLEIRSSNSGAMALLSPTTIADLAVYVNSSTGCYQDAAKAVPCTANGDLVYTWDNQGNTALVLDWVQATSGSRPVYNVTGGVNGKPRITFDGTRLATLANVANFTQQFTSIMVLKVTGGAGGGPYLFSDSSNVIAMGVDYAGSNKTFIYFNGSTALGSINTPASEYLLVTVANGASSEIYTNTVPNTLSANPGPGALSGTFYLARSVGGTAFMIGDLYEQMFFSRALTPAEMCQIQNYAQGTYALTGW